jgi:autotransporter family porin
MTGKARRAASARKFAHPKFRTDTVPPRLRRGLLLGASGLTLALALGVRDEAAAFDECGAAAGAPPSVSCTSAGNPYPNGIRYDVEDLTIVVKSGVVVDTTGAAGEDGGIVSGGTSSAPGGSGNLVVTIDSGVNITTDDNYAVGVGAVTYSGDSTVASKGAITTSGYFAAGIWAESDSNDVKVSASGTITTSGDLAFGINAATFVDNVTNVVNSSATITTTGGHAFGIVGDTGSGANADVSITSTGRIATSGDDAAGLYGYTTNTGSDILIVNTGTITAAGNVAEGIRALARGDGSLVRVGSAGRIVTGGDDAEGILAGTTNAGSDITVLSIAPIATSGHGSEGIFALSAGAGSDIAITSRAAVTTRNAQADGIRAFSNGAGSRIGIASTGPIVTRGDQSDGINGRAQGGGATLGIASAASISTAGDQADAIDASAAANVTVLSTRAIVTKGAESDGIEAESGFGNVLAGSTGSILTSGADADGFHVVADSGDIGILNMGRVTTTGGGSGGSDGIWSRALHGAITIDSRGPVATSGAQSDAVHAEGGDSIAITVEQAVADGADSDGIDASNGLLGAIDLNVLGEVSGGWGSAQGVRVKTGNPGTLTIGAGGSVGALSDFAVSEGGDDMAVFNNGTVTGYLDLSSGNDSFDSSVSGAWALRDFADTDGDGVRDTEGVAFASFGLGSDSFDNSGTLSLGEAIGATSFDTTGAIADPHGTDGDMTLPGVEQGQIVGLEQFTNSGVITLQDGRTGDFLAITDRNVAGPDGGSVFISNGGSLDLDVRLDDGSSGKADMLFLDYATVAEGGATRVFVSNAGGAGALTKGDGIEVIHVAETSTDDAFALGAPVVAGAYEYNLEFQNLAGTDQSWYLRSTPFAGAAAYPAIASSAITTWQADLASLQRRLGDLRLRMNRPQAPLAVPGIAGGDSMQLDPARFAGGWFSMTDSSDRVAQGGIAGFSQETGGAQFGYDLALDNVFGRDDWLVLGAFGGQGWSQADFDQTDATADFDTSAMGIYGSYFSGPYHLDALVKFDWLDGDYSSNAVSSGGDVTLPVFGASLETGYRFDLAKSETGALSLQPLAGLDYAHAGGDSFRDDSGADIRLLDMESLRGRLGARLVQQLLPAEDGTGPVGSLYLEAGVAQEFLGRSEARVTGVTLRQELPDTTLRFGAGFDIALPADGLSFTFATNADLSGGEDSFGATGGVKFTW